MRFQFNQFRAPRVAGFLTRLARDRAGNTLAMIAAAVFPVLGLVGGGIDMGRGYLSQSRLQQACDAGVLAARKKMGANVPQDGILPAAAERVGNKFFNLNYRSGAYGSTNRTFTLTLETDAAVSGRASVTVPTTIMRLFGRDQIPLQVDCQARLNFSNTDIMFVLDTTGSMADTNPGDSEPKIAALRDVVKSFYSTLESTKTPGTRIRYGFVPYSTNVNVGYLLKPDWVVDKWTYHGRVAQPTGETQTVDTYTTTFNVISGNVSAIGTYQTTSCPASTAVWTVLAQWTDPDGTFHQRVQVNGDTFGCTTGTEGTTVTVSGTRYNNYIYEWSQKKTGTTTVEIRKWEYKPVQQDLSFLKGPTAASTLSGGSVDVPMIGSAVSPQPLTAYFRGCVEERDTYQIDDYNNVDLNRAMDLDIDRIPTAGDPATQWRPMLNEISFEPEIWWDGSGNFKTNPDPTYNEYLMAQWARASACPAPSRKLAEMSANDVNTYVDALTPEGKTYHDIGMIWGARLLSPTGLFQAENADVSGKTTSRHLIFLTDGLTEPADISYGAYGIEPLDRRRWSPASTDTLTQTIEKRFGVACAEAKKRNITVWVIGFGVSLNPVMTECAGPGHSFEAKDNAELNDVFSRIAAQLGDLRISK